MKHFAIFFTPNENVKKKCNNNEIIIPDTISFVWLNAFPVQLFCGEEKQNYNIHRLFLFSSSLQTAQSMTKVSVRSRDGGGTHILLQFLSKCSRE